MDALEGLCLIVRSKIDQSLAESVRKPRWTIEQVVAGVSAELGVPIKKLLSRDRSGHVAFVRQVAAYFCRRLTGLSFPVIGEHLGRDHSTVIHAFNLISSRAAREEPFRLTLAKIQKRIEQSPQRPEASEAEKAA